MTRIEETAYVLHTLMAPEGWWEDPVVKHENGRSWRAMVITLQATAATNSLTYYWEFEDATVSLVVTFDCTVQRHPNRPRSKVGGTPHTTITTGSVGGNRRRAAAVMQARPDSQLERDLAAVHALGRRARALIAPSARTDL